MQKGQSDKNTAKRNNITMKKIDIIMTIIKRTILHLHLLIPKDKLKIANKVSYATNMN